MAHKQQSPAAGMGDPSPLHTRRLDRASFHHTTSAGVYSPDLCQCLRLDSWTLDLDQLQGLTFLSLSFLFGKCVSFPSIPSKE